LRARTIRASSVAFRNSTSFAVCPLGRAAPFFEGSDWRSVLREFAPDWPERVRRIGAIPRLKRAPGGWAEA
jgi:hypothetical protein